MEVQNLHASAQGPSPGRANADADAYAAVLLRHTDHVLQLFVGERLMNKIFARVFQSHAMGRLVIAHFDWKAGVGPRPTLAWLQEKTGCTRTLAAFVGIARVAKLVRSECDPEDQRQRFLTPGDRVVEGLRAWLQHHFQLAEALGVMSAGCSQQLMDDECYFERYVRASALVIDGLGDSQRLHPRWHWLDSHHCGHRIAYAYLRAHCLRALETGTCVHDPLWITLGSDAVSKMLGISKSHVRNVVNGAEERGAIEHHASRRQLRLTSDFLSESRAFFLHLLELMQAAHRRAVAF